MKILVFGISTQRGGVESFILNYLQAFHSIYKDCSFHFVVIDSVASFLSEVICNYDSVHIVPSRTKRPIKYCSELQRVLKEVNPDIVWYNVCTLSDITLPLIAHRMGIPVVFHSHNSSNMGSSVNQLFHRLHKKLVGCIGDAYLACSDFAADFMYPKSLKKSTRIIPNAIDVAKFSYCEASRSSIRQDLGCEDAFVYGHVGRFHSQKNHQYLISVFKRIHDEDPTSLLLLFGDGPGEDIVRAEVESLGLRGSVVFMGSVANIERYYSAMDCFLLPSLYEGFPMCLVEAQSSGLPCLVSDTISRSVAITELVRFLPIDDVSAWHQAAIDRVALRSYNRLLAARSVELAGYDIYRAASVMHSTFSSVSGKL